MDRFVLHRPEIGSQLERGERKIIELMQGNRRALSAGSILVEADTGHDFVYRLVEGWAGRTRELEDGRNQFILIFLPGDLFALKSMFVTTHPDSIITLSDIVVDQIDYRKLREGFEKDADIAIRCNWQIVEEERRLHNWVVSLGRGSPDERVALLIVEFHGRLARAGKISIDATEFDLPMTQNQLADHLGLSPVHINRVLKAMREDGILRLKNGKVIVTDPAKLKRLARPLGDYHERNAPEAAGPSRQV